MEDGSIKSTVEIISNKDILLSLTITEIVGVDTDQVFKNCDDYYSFSIEIIERRELKVCYTLNYREAMKKEDGMNIMTNTDEYKKGDYLSYGKYVQSLILDGYKILDK